MVKSQVELVKVMGSQVGLVRVMRSQVEMMKVMESQVGLVRVMEQGWPGHSGPTRATHTLWCPLLEGLGSTSLLSAAYIVH